MAGQDAAPHESHHGLVPEEGHMGEQPHAEENSVDPGQGHEDPRHDVRRGNGGVARFPGGIHAQEAQRVGTGGARTSRTKECALLRSPQLERGADPALKTAPQALFGPGQLCLQPSGLRLGALELELERGNLRLR